MLFVAGLIWLLWPGTLEPETSKHGRRALRVHRIKKSANRQIDFYGKVVDQNGDPVEGVKLEIKILSYQTTKKPQEAHNPQKLSHPSRILCILCLLWPHLEGIEGAF